MRSSTLARLAALLLVALLAPATAAQTFTSVTDGNWSDPNTWDQPTAPTVGSDVVIEDNDDVVLDVNADINDLTINEDLLFTGAVGVTLTVRGSITMGPSTRFRPNDGTTGSYVGHQLILEGNFTGDGEVDFRRGSNSSNTSSGVDVTFQGSGNSIVALTGPSSAQLLDNFSGIARANEFNSITFAKTGSGRVIFQSSVESSNNSSTGPATCNFDGGLVEVVAGQALVCASSASSTVTQSDPNSYVIGTFGRGLGNSGGVTSFFPVGDETRARPISIDSEATGKSAPFLLVTLVTASADALATIYEGDLQKVSEIRYYRVQYDDEGENVSGVLTDLEITYGPDDGVSDGNSDLRVATSQNSGTTWTERGGSSHTTDASGATIESGTFSITLSDEQTLLLALGNAIGGANELTLNPPPVFSAAFSPSTTVPDAVSTLTFTIQNIAGAEATDLSFYNSLPSGLSVAMPSNMGTTCGDGMVFPGKGPNDIYFVGGSVAGGATCTVSVDVTANAVGTYVNTSGDLTSSLGNSGTASATLTVVSGIPTISFAVVQQTVREDAGSVLLTLELSARPAETAQATVTLVQGDPADLGGFESVTIPVGPGPETPPTITVEVPVTDDGRNEGQETFFFELSLRPQDASVLTVGSRSQSAVIIIDNDERATTISIAKRDADGDGVEDGGPRLLSLPVGGLPVSELAAATGAGQIFWFRNGPTPTLAPPNATLAAGEPLLLEVAPGASLSISGTAPLPGPVVSTGIALGQTPGRVLLPLGNPTFAPIRLNRVEISGGTLGDVVLVFDPESGSFRPVSIAGLGGPNGLVVDAFTAVMLQVTPSPTAPRVTASVPLGGAANGTGQSISGAPFTPRSGEKALVVTLSPQTASGADGGAQARLAPAPGDRLALRFLTDGDAGLDSFDGVDVTSPFGATLAARGDAGLGPFAALATDPLASGATMTVPLVVSVPAAGVYEVSAVPTGTANFAVEVLDGGVATALEAGEAFTFTASAADAANPAAFEGRFALRVSPRNSVSTGDGVDAIAVDVFPNPSAGLATVSIEGALLQHVRVTLYDALGREAAVLHDGPAASQLQVDAGRLAPGLYVVRIEGESFVESRSLTIVR